MIPNPAELDRLIRSPVQWSKFLISWEEQSSIADGLSALRELPESSIRDTRIAILLWRLGRWEEAKATVYQHNKCPLAKSWYFAFLAEEGQENTLKMMLENYRPDWEIVEFTDLEASFRAHLVLGSVAAQLRKHHMAQEHFLVAQRIADGLDDRVGKRLVHFESARSRLFNDVLPEARSTFFSLMRIAPENSKMFHTAADYAALISLLMNDTPEELPLWAKEVLTALRKRAPITTAALPSSVVLPWMIPVFHALKELTDEFHTKLPLFHVRDNQARRAELIETIRSVAGDGGSEADSHLAECALALALSMEHNPSGIKRLKNALNISVSGISVVNMVHFATLIQVHSNLPHVPRDEDVRRAFHTLCQQYWHLPEGQRRFLNSWLQDYCPSTLYVMAQHIPALQQYTEKYMVVSPTSVWMGKQKIRAYPKKFMCGHLFQILSGHPIPEGQRHQAHRHRHLVEDLGVPRVVFLPTLEGWLS